MNGLTSKERDFPETPKWEPLGDDRLGAVRDEAIHDAQEVSEEFAEKFAKRILELTNDA